MKASDWLLKARSNETEDQVAEVDRGTKEQAQRRRASGDPLGDTLQPTSVPPSG